MIVIIFIIYNNKDKDALSSALNNCVMNNLSMDLYLATDNDDDNEVQSISMNELKGNSQLAHQFPHVSLLQQQQSQYDITIANILAPILIYLASDLYSLTKIGGKIALSGLIINIKIIY